MNETSLIPATKPVDPASNAKNFRIQLEAFDATTSFADLFNHFSVPTAPVAPESNQRTEEQPEEAPEPAETSDSTPQQDQKHSARAVHVQRRGDEPLQVTEKDPASQFNNYVEPVATESKPSGVKVDHQPVVDNSAQPLDSGEPTPDTAKVPKLLQQQGNGDTEVGENLKAQPKVVHEIVETPQKQSKRQQEIAPTTPVRPVSSDHEHAGSETKTFTEAAPSGKQPLDRNSDLTDEAPARRRKQVGRRDSNPGPNQRLVAPNHQPSTSRAAPEPVSSQSLTPIETAPSSIETLGGPLQDQSSQSALGVGPNNFNNQSTSTVRPTGTTIEGRSDTGVSRLETHAPSGIRKSKPTPKANQTSRIRLLSRVTKAFQQLAADGGGDLRIKLHPPKLGSVGIQLRVAKKNIDARIVTETDTAKNAIRDSIPELRQRLAEHGFQIESVEVFTETGQQQSHNQATPWFEDAVGNPLASTSNQPLSQQSASTTSTLDSSTGIDLLG